MNPTLTPYPFDILRLVGQYKVHLYAGLNYIVKVWEHPNRTFVAYVSFRLRTPSGVISFEAVAPTPEQALGSAVSQVLEETRKIRSEELGDRMETVPGESF
jgi:hypothetical protein